MSTGYEKVKEDLKDKVKYKVLIGEIELDRAIEEIKKDIEKEEKIFNYDGSVDSFSVLLNFCQYSNVDISDVSQLNYVQKILAVTALRDYAIEQEGRVKAFLAVYSATVELLKDYADLWSGCQMANQRKSQINVKLSDLIRKQTELSSLMERLSGKKEMFLKKYDSLSRILSNWGLEEKFKSFSSSSST